MKKYPGRLARLFRVRSLAARTTLVFAALVSVVWATLVAWVVYDSLTRGREIARKDMRDYARQVIAVAERWPGDDSTLAQAVLAVARIENNTGDTTDQGPADGASFRIQLWRDGRSVTAGDSGQSSDPLPDATDEVIEFRRHGVRRWAYVAHSDSRDITVRLSLNAPINSVVGWPSVSIFLLPLVLSLPFLLIPAWVMTRYGLRPLQTMTDEILSRVEQGNLSPLESTPYKELNPLLEAMNKLMSRLSKQIERERGFVADVAHEIKTPLAALAANTGTAINSPDPHRRQAALKDLEPGLDRVTHLVKQLLGMARLDVDAAPDSERTFDLAELLRERIGLQLTVARGRKITVQACLPDRLTVSINPDQIGAIIDNVVGNAVKYSPDGGRISVVLSPTGENAGFEINVSDNGPGVPPEERERVFERFYRRASLLHEADGAGLGLAITKRAVDRLGGSIVLSSAPGGGLSVSINIPVAN